MTINKSCESCLSAFVPYHPNTQKLCSACSAKKNKKQSHTFIQKKCEQCGDEFAPKTTRVRFCSIACGQRAYYVEQLPDLSRLGSKGPARGTKQTSEHVTKRRHALELTLSKMDRTCVHCEELFVPTQAAQKYCSGRCWNAVARKKKTRLHKISVPVDVYAELLARQNGKCKICGVDGGSNNRGDKLAVDHIHGTTKIRGLLCHKCNTGIGLFKDKIENLQSAIKYLMHAESQFT